MRFVAVVLIVLVAARGAAAQERDKVSPPPTSDLLVKMPSRILRAVTNSEDMHFLGYLTVKTRNWTFRGPAGADLP